MNKIILSILVACIGSYSQLMVPYPSTDATKANLEKLKISNWQQLCLSPSAVSVLKVSEISNSIPTTFTSPNLFVCADFGYHRVMAARLEYDEDWLETNGVLFSTYENTSGSLQFLPSDMVQDGLGNFWVSDMANGQIVKLTWNMAENSLDEQPSELIEGIESPASMTLDVDNNNAFVLYVLDHEASALYKVDISNKTVTHAEVDSLFKNILKISNAWNPFSHVDQDFLYAITYNSILKIRKSTLSVESKYDISDKAVYLQDIVVASNGQIVVSDKMSGSLISIDPSFTARLWQTPRKGSSYDAGGMPVFSKPFSLDVYFDHLIVGEPVIGETMGIRDVVFHQKESISPEVTEVQSNCVGTGGRATFYVNNPNPGAVWIDPANNWFEVDGVRKNGYSVAFEPNTKRYSGISVPFQQYVTWHLDGNTATSTGVAPSNTCPTLPILPEIRKIVKKCSEIGDYYNVYLAYNNQNAETITLPQGPSSRLYPYAKFDAYAYMTPAVYLPGYHSSTTGNENFFPVRIPVDAVDGDIMTIQWKLLNRISMGKTEGYFDECVEVTPSLSLHLKDVGFYENNITKPMIVLVNESTTESVSDISIRFWISKEEQPNQQFQVDKYYTNPSDIALQVGSNMGRDYVQATFPSSFVLATQASFGLENLQFGVHFNGYWPGQWNKNNDWSFEGIDGTLKLTDKVTVYSKGKLIYGREPVAVITVPSSSSTSSSSNASSSSFSCTGACLNAKQVEAPNVTMTLNSLDEAWFVMTSLPDGWQASEMADRQIQVNGVNVYAGQIPLPAAIDGKWYFHFSNGLKPWASWSWWGTLAPSSSSSSEPDGLCSVGAGVKNSCGSFQTTGPTCIKVFGGLNGWNASNMSGRTVRINGSSPVSLGDGNQPSVQASSDGYTYLDFSMGSYSYASCATW